MATWLTTACFAGSSAGSRTPRSDGNIVEVSATEFPPRPRATVVKQSDVSIPWALPPGNLGVGPCHDPYFKLVPMPQVRHVYGANDVMSIGIHYEATGCKNMIVTFAGRHQAGSPWYEHWCNDVIHVQLKAPTYDCGAWVPSNLGRHASLAANSGTVVFHLGTGNDEGLLPGDPVISIEGFELCELVIALDDGVPDGSRTWQQVELGCSPDSKTPEP